MKANASYLNHIMDLLAPIGNIRSRAMFGGYGIFLEGDMFALIWRSTLYFKVNESNRTDYEKAGSRQFHPMPYYEVPAEVMENNRNATEMGIYVHKYQSRYGKKEKAIIALIILT